MNHRLLDVEGRRHFIKSVSASAFSLAALPLDLGWPSDSVETFLDTRRPSITDIVDRKEPGLRLVIRGMVHDLDGKPEPNVKIFLYQTDAAGYYSRPVNNPRQARLRGTVWSDAKGHYEFRTIRPAHYAEMDSPPPMHIHVHLEPPNLPNHWVDSYYFEGDPRLRRDEMDRANELGRFSHVIKLSPGKLGVLQGIRHFRIDPSTAARNQVAGD